MLCDLGDVLNISELSHLWTAEDCLSHECTTFSVPVQPRMLIVLVTWCLGELSYWAAGSTVPTCNSAPRGKGKP